MLREPLFLLETSTAFDISQNRFSNNTVVIMVHLGCLCSNKLHISLLDRRIMSKLTDFETMSKSSQVSVGMRILGNSGGNAHCLRFLLDRGK